MSFNIPVNLMNTVAPAAQNQQPPSGSEEAPPSQTVQPAGGAQDTQGTSPDTGANANSGQRDTQQPPRPIPAEAASVSAAITAQAADTRNTELDAARAAAQRGVDMARTQALIDSIAATPTAKTDLLERPEKLDRYAPPDPLPTAPILTKSAPTAIKTS